MNRFRAEKPEEHEYTLSMTYTLKQWMELREQLEESRPRTSIGNSFVREIDSMVSQAKKIYWPVSE